MSVGSRFRSTPETPSLKTTIGAALIGVAMLGGTAGVSLAQEASPAASPAAIVVDWIEGVAIESETNFDGDRSSVGVVFAEEATINVANIESRPYIILQTENRTEAALHAAVFSVPEDHDASTFTFPASEADLPEGVTAIGSYTVEPGEQTAAVFTDLAIGNYVVATTTGLVVPFAISDVVDLGVPDIFASPEA